MIYWPVTVLRPNGKPMDDIKVIISPLGGENEWLFVNIYANYDKGVFWIPWYSGKPLNVGIVYNEFVEEAFHFTFPAAEKAPDKPSVIQLDKEQIEIYDRFKPEREKQRLAR